MHTEHAPDVEASDHALMARIREGDREAFAALLQSYWAPLLRYATRLLDDEDSAEDVVQDSWVRVWRFRAEWRPVGTVAGYLYRIVRNLALNSIREGRTRARWSEAGAAQLRSQGAIPSPSDEATSEALHRAVEEAIARLSPRRREIFLLARHHGLSHREIAGVLEIALPTVANQMSSALAQLREQLAPHLSE